MYRFERQQTPEVPVTPEVRPDTEKLAEMFTVLGREYGADVL